MPVQAPHPRRVLNLSTGGTLGMRSGVNGPLEPGEMLEDLLTWIPELRDYAEIEVEILECRRHHAANDFKLICGQGGQ